MKATKLCFCFPETLYSLVSRERVSPSPTLTTAIVIVRSAMTTAAASTTLGRAVNQQPSERRGLHTTAAE